MLPICDVRSNPVDLGPKLGSAERALAAIRAGSRIYIGTGCAAPRALLARLEAMEPGPADLEFVSFLTTSALPQVGGSPRTRYRHRAFFVGSEVRGLAGSGQLDYVPIFVGGDTETADQRTAADRRGFASGFPA
jgi:acyl-CoA hydrolase